MLHCAIVIKLNGEILRKVHTYIPIMQICTLRLLKVFILLVDLLIQLIKHGKETAEVIVIPGCIIEDQLSVALYKHSKTDFFLTIKTSNTSKSL